MSQQRRTFWLCVSLKSHPNSQLRRELRRTCQIMGLPEIEISPRGEILDPAWEFLPRSGARMWSFEVRNRRGETRHERRWTWTARLLLRGTREEQAEAIADCFRSILAVDFKIKPSWGLDVFCEFAEYKAPGRVYRPAGSGDAETTARIIARLRKEAQRRLKEYVEAKVKHSSDPLFLHQRVEWIADELTKTLTGVILRQEFGSGTTLASLPEAQRKVIENFLAREKKRMIVEAFKK